MSDHTGATLMTETNEEIEARLKKAQGVFVSSNTTIITFNLWLGKPLGK